MYFFLFYSNFLLKIRGWKLYGGAVLTNASLPIEMEDLFKIVHSEGLKILLDEAQKSGPRQTWLYCFPTIWVPNGGDKISRDDNHIQTRVHSITLIYCPHLCHQHSAKISVDFPGVTLHCTNWNWCCLPQCSDANVCYAASDVVKTMWGGLVFTIN